MADSATIRKPTLPSAHAELDDKPSPTSKFPLTFVHLICFAAIPISSRLCFMFYGENLVSNPLRFLQVLWTVQCPIAILVFSWFRHDHNQCSILGAAIRGALTVPLGGLVNALGATLLGAPVGLQYLWKTFHWSIFMSSLTFVPAACVVGTSWGNWRYLLSCRKISVGIDSLICFTIHGALIGGWLGAWPMPLDWERPWQEWPISVTYGAIFGYLFALLLSFVFMVTRPIPTHTKFD